MDGAAALLIDNQVRWDVEGAGSVDVEAAMAIPGDTVSGFSLDSTKATEIWT